MPAITHGEVLATLIAEHGWTRGAELGVFRGETFLYLLDRFPSLHLTGVDTWDDTPRPYDKNKETGERNYSIFPLAEYERDVCAKAAAFGDRARILKTTTLEAVAQIPDGSLDFVFIDACHETAAVAADIRAWLPKLKPSGWLTGHDRNWPSVRRALDAELPGWAPAPAAVWVMPRANIARMP